MAKTTYIGIGSNMGHPQSNCEQAIGYLAHHPGIIITACSSFYETEPLGIKEQTWFINAVITIQTRLTPENLMQALLDIEKKMGRIRQEKWGPRIIDLDLLFYGDQIIEAPNLRVPHPEIPRRRFVLAPLEEVHPEFLHPVLKKTIRELLEALAHKDQVAHRLS